MTALRAVRRRAFLAITTGVAFIMLCIGCATAFSCVSVAHSRPASPISSVLESSFLLQARARANPRGSVTTGTETGWSWAHVGVLTAITLAVAFRRPAGSSQSRSETSMQRVSCRAGSVEGVRVLGGWANATNNTFTHETISDIRITKCENGIMQVSGIVPARLQGLEEEHELARGTTENSYIIYDDKEEFATGRGPLLLVDIPEMRFSEAFITKLSPYIRRVEGLVLTHINEEEDNMMFKVFMDAKIAKGDSKKVTVHLSQVAKDALVEDFEGDDMLNHVDFNVVEHGSTIPLPSAGETQDCAIRALLRQGCASEGIVQENDKKLCFTCIGTATLPEGIGMFDQRHGFLFSSKLFSAHTSQAPPSGDPTWKDFALDWHHFFDCYFFTETAQKSVRRIYQISSDFSQDDLGLMAPDVKALAPLHGPVIKNEAWRLMAKYEAWLERKLHLTNREGTALIMYTSAYGNTKRMADAIKAGILSTGVEVNELDLEFSSNDDIAEALRKCDGLAIGSPTLGGEMPIQAKEAIGVILEQAQEGSNKVSVRAGDGKAASCGIVPCGVFGSYGWSGEAVEEMQMRLKDGGFSFAFDPIRCKFTPTQAVVEELEEAGVRLAQKISESVKDKAAEALAKATKTFSKGEDKNSSTDEAFSRIINSSSILVTKSGDNLVRLPVSWVSQASFVPPGVMLAVAQEGLHSFLSLSVDEQLTVLFEKYDADGSGELDKEETMFLLDDLLGATGDLERDMLNEKKEKAWKTLDADGSGEIEVDELRAAAQDGPLAEMIAEQRRFASLEAVLSGANHDTEFTLCMLPSDLSVEDALKADFITGKKNRAKNGCDAIQGCAAYVECKVEQLSRTGNYALLYGQVLAGEVLNANAQTQLLCATHERLEGGEVASGETTGEEASGLQSELAMAAMPSIRDLSSSRMQSTFAGASLSRAASSGVKQRLQPRRAWALAEPVVASQEEKWTGLTPGKEYKLQTSCQEIAEDTRTIRSLDWDRDRFDIEFALSNGTTYNAYTIKGETHTALIDASHRKFEKLFMDALESPAGGGLDLATLDYLVVSHTEPDHSGLVADVLRRAREKGNTDLTVVGSKVCINFLKDLMHVNFKSKMVKSGEKIDLGGGHELEFVLAPNLHWPDTIFTFDHKTQLLFTCDAFGMHYCSNEVTDAEDIDTLNPHYQLYYNCLMRPNARSVLSALKKIKDLDVKAIATGHGPIMVNNLDEWVNRYRGWSEKATKKLGPSVVVFWVSRYGDSERLAQSYAYGLTTSDVVVEMQDLNACDAFEITEAILRNQVIVVFSPSRGSEGAAAQQALSSVIANCTPKSHKFVVCSSGGDQDEPVDSIIGRFVQIGIPEAAEPVRIVDSVKEKDLQVAEESARVLARGLTAKKKQDKKAKLDQKTMEALGKMSSGRYILTATKSEVNAAEVATWVMPVSTQPLSVAVAVAKDRNITSLMQMGDLFVVNALEEGNYINILKHFQQDFKPGENVFDGIDVVEVMANSENGSSNRGVVVAGSCAYVVCKVVGRMDANDHYVISGQVVQGNMVKDAPIAVNHRKSAAYY